MKTSEYVIPFEECDIGMVSRVGGKCASLGRAHEGPNTCSARFRHHDGCISPLYGRQRLNGQSAAKAGGPG